MRFNMRKLIYYVACSVDRFIAHSDGTHEGFLMEGEHFVDLIANFPETFPAQFRDVLGISGENKCFDTVLMGRRTYEVGLKEGVTNPYPQMQQYVFSRTLPASIERNIELISTAIGAVGLDRQSDCLNYLPITAFSGRFWVSCACGMLSVKMKLHRRLVRGDMPFPICKDDGIHSFKKPLTFVTTASIKSTGLGFAEHMML
jgi:hypothetical protein